MRELNYQYWIPYTIVSYLLQINADLLSFLPAYLKPKVSHVDAFTAGLIRVLRKTVS